MSELIMSVEAAQENVTGTQLTVAGNGEVFQPPDLITEQEVMFGTAVAVRVPSKETAGQWIALLRPRRLFTRSTADKRVAKHRHYPRHYDFLERALMAREMDRL